MAGVALCVGLQVPYLVLSPGPVFNTIGQVDGTDAIKVSGTTTYDTDGTLDMTTVSEYGGAEGGVSLAQAVLGWMSGTKRVVPRESIYPESESHAEAARQGAEQFATSQSHAIAAALSNLGMPVRTSVVVSAVSPGTPAQGELHAGDRITAVDGTRVTTPDQVVSAVRSQPVGSDLRFSVVRNGSTMDVTIRSAARQDDPQTSQNEAGMPYVGAGIDTLFAADFDVAFTIERVGGPSAGLMFALGLVDKLTPGPLTAGHKIAGTGTISPEGAVGAIGGIAQKMAGARGAGAELFLTPKANCADIASHIPAGLTVTPVESLAEAITAVQEFTRGQQVPACGS